jgi:hypothetical protein
MRLNLVTWLLARFFLGFNVMASSSDSLNFDVSLDMETQTDRYHEDPPDQPYIQPPCGEGPSTCINACVKKTFKKYNKTYKDVPVGECRSAEAFCDVFCGGW